MTTEYERLKAQRYNIENEQAQKKTDKIMAELQSRKGLLDGIDDETLAEIFTAIQGIILGRKVSP